MFFFVYLIVTSFSLSVFGVCDISFFLSLCFPRRSKLPSLFPRTSFGGGMTLSEAGLDLLTGLLDMNPDKVNVFVLLVMHSCMHSRGILYVVINIWLRRA